MEQFAQTLKQAFYNSGAFTVTLFRYQTKVRKKHKTASQFLAFNLFDRACTVLSYVLSDRDMNTLNFLDCEAWSCCSIETVMIECRFYKNVKHCATVREVFYIKKNEITYRNVIMDNYPAIYIEDAMKKDMQEMKKYLYIFRNVLFEIIKEIQPEMKFRKI